MPAPVRVDSDEPAAGHPPLTPDQLLDAVLEIVHVRTGYPREMLDPTLDLEADLSVDSIKRVEIIGALADRIGLPRGADGPADSAVEELSRLKTIGGIVDWIVTRDAAAEAVSADGPVRASGPPAPEEVAAAPVPLPDRLLVEVAPIGPANTRDPADVLPGLRLAVVDDGLGVAAALAAALESHGAEVRTLHPDRLADAAGADGVVDLSALRPAPAPVLPENFAALRDILTEGTHRLLLVTGRGGDFGRSGSPDPVPGAGLYGFARTAAIEHPGTAVRAVDVDPKDRPERIAAHLIAELCAPEEPLVIGYTNGTRNTLRTVSAPLPVTEAMPPLPIGRDAVVLLTGGARGITARTALALAKTTGCHIEVVGRTSRPEEAEDPAVAHAHDRVSLRAALFGKGLRTPAEIEIEATRILAAREVRATLAALDSTAASVRYHVADVTDAEAVRAVVHDIRTRHGRLDGIVHGAGTIEDRRLADKDPASFARVFATKVDGARHLAHAAADHGEDPAPPSSLSSAASPVSSATAARPTTRLPMKPWTRSPPTLPGHAGSQAVC